MMWWLIWIIWIILGGPIKSSLGLHHNCDFNMTSWDCDDFHHYFSVRNVEETLKCIGYRKYKRPEQPLTIDFGRQIRQLMKIDENERNVLFEEKIWLEFNDPRLQFNFCQDLLELGQNKVEFLTDLSNIFWKPDLDTPPETLFKPNLDRVLVKDNGRIKVSNLNLRSTVRCAMDYTWYPFDTQICSHPILIDEPSITINYDDHEVVKESTVEQFEDPDWKITLRAGNCKNGGQKHCFSMDLIFERKISTHILHEYVPSLMLAIASTASLFIPAECMPARMSLSVTTCLSMITLFVNAK